MRCCTICGVEKPLTDFPKDKNIKDGRRRQCKACRYAATNARRVKYANEINERAKATRKADPIRFRGYALKQAHNISLATYDSILAKQGGLCAICQTGDPRGRHKTVFHVDHDHTTGKIRGLLCGHCNTGLGQFLDNPRTLLRAARYLVKHDS